MKSALYDLDAPDEMADLNLKGAARPEIMKATYETWSAAVKPLFDSTFGGKDRSLILGLPEMSYKMACRVLKPYAEDVKGTVSRDDLPFLGNDIFEHYLSGLYLSALLNRTAVTEMKLKSAPQLEYIGYRLGDLDNGPKTLWLGKKTFINNIGENAVSGLCVVEGDSKNIGQSATGGSFVTLGLTAHIGYYSHGVTFVNFGEYSEVGQYCDGCMFVTKTKSYPDGKTAAIPQGKMTTPYGADIIYVGPAAAESDGIIASLLSQIEASAREEKFDARKIDADVERLKDYVRTKYVRKIP